MDLEEGTTSKDAVPPRTNKHDTNKHDKCDVWCECVNVRCEFENNEFSRRLKKKLQIKKQKNVNKNNAQPL